METIAHHLWIGFVGGLLAFAHCLGMCGGFVLHLSQEKERKKMVAGQFLWQAGRISTYTLLGAVAGYAGGFLQAIFLNNVLFRHLLTYLAGGIIILMGLSLLGFLPVRGTAAGTSSILAFCGKFISGTSPGAALSLGIATGFLPCPIPVAFLAYALQTGSVVTGMAVMAALGLGTMVPLLALGGITRLTKLHLRNWAPTAGGIILILLGVTTALRGSGVLHHLLGCSPPLTMAQPAQGEVKKPCCEGKVHGSGSGN